MSMQPVKMILVRKQITSMMMKVQMLPLKSWILMKNHLKKSRMEEPAVSHEQRVSFSDDQLLLKERGQSLPAVAGLFFLSLLFLSSASA